MKSITHPAPFITLSGAAGSTTDRSQIVSGTAFDGPNGCMPLSGADVSITVGQIMIGTATVAPNGSWSTDVLLPNLGENQLVATVLDPSGQTATSSPLTFDLETVTFPPTGSGSAPSPGGSLPPLRSSVTIPFGGTVAAEGPKETFVFYAHPGHLVINDLADPGDLHDRLSFSAHSFSSIVGILHHTTSSAAGVTIHISPSDSINLPGMTLAALRAHHDMLMIHS